MLRLAAAVFALQRDGLDYGDEHYEVEFHAFGDYKWLNDICGLSSAGASHPCLWCVCTRADIQAENSFQQAAVSPYAARAHRLQAPSKAPIHALSLFAAGVCLHYTL